MVLVLASKNSDNTGSYHSLGNSDEYMAWFLKTHLIKGYQEFWQELLPEAPCNDTELVDD